MKRLDPRMAAVLCLALAAVAGCSSITRTFESPEKRFRRNLERLASPNADERRTALLEFDQDWDWRTEEGRVTFANMLANRLRGDTDNLVRMTCARILRRYPRPETTRALTEALADQDELVRVEAARSLAGVADADAVVILMRLVKSDANAQVRAAAAGTLGLLPLEPGRSAPAAVLDCLLEALDDRDFAVVHRSAQSLAQLTGLSHGTDRRAWETALRAAASRPAP